MNTINSVKKEMRNLRAGDVVVNTHITSVPHRTVKRVDDARAPGYVIVQFTDADRISGHGESVYNILVK